MVGWGRVRVGARVGKKVGWGREGVGQGRVGGMVG